MMRLPYELHLAVRYLRFHRGRTFLSLITMISVLGVSVGTAALVIALALNAGFVDDVHARIYSGSAHLTVLSARELTFADGTDVVGRTQQVPGVTAASRVLYTPAMLTRDDQPSTGFAEVHGVDPEGHARVLGADVAQSPFRELAVPPADGREPVLIGEDLARRIGVIEGDSVRVVVPQVTLSPWGPQPRSAVFRVAGTYASGHFQQDSQRAYMHIHSVERLLRAAGDTSWVEVRLDNLKGLESMKGELSAALGAPWLVIDLIEQNQDILKALATEKLLLFLAIGLIVVVAALNIVSTLILMVTDKVKEIGTLSAMGATPGGIAAVFILQGGVIGSVGTVTGLLLGSGISYWVDRLKLIRLNPDVYYLTHLPFSLRALDITAVGVGVLVVSLLATIYPAFRAATLRPVDAIRYE